MFETDESTLVSASSPYAFTVSYGDYYKDNLKNSKIPVVVSESHAVNITDENTAHALLKTSDKAGVLPIDADKNWDYKSKSIDNTELGITDVATQNTMLVVFVIIIPIAILVAGFVFWLRRRNR